MKKIIIITTINPPTEAIKKFNELDGWKLIIVGDKKTPHELYKDYDYLSPEYQENTYPRLSELIGWNKCQRRNIGFLEAYKRGADIIASSDDDNIPYENWGKDIKIGKNIKDLMVYDTTDICFDPISVTNHFKLWHRGFPIQLLHNRNLRTSIRTETARVDVQANFWNGSPDVDSICRFEHNPKCLFNPKHFPFMTTAFSPFNSQNTFFTREAIKHYFVFPFIGRMDDIWASYYLEAIGFNVVYDIATVCQKRNEHDLTKDFEDEIPGYLNNMNLLEDLKKNPDNLKKYIPKESWEAFQEYKRQFK